MRSQALRVTRFLGIDRAVGFTILGRVWSLATSAVSLWMIVHFLNKDEQGFYYTFGSVLGLQIFFELGLSYVILQYASHEMADLKFNEQRLVQGDAVAKARLASLLWFAMKWYGVVAFLVVLLVLPSGLWFFSSHYPSDLGVVWKGPWTILSLATAASLFLSPLWSIVEGVGRVAETAMMRMCQGIFSTLVMWAALFSGCRLYASPILSSLNVLFASAWLIVRFGPFLLDLMRSRTPVYGVRWWEEIFPFQWKIAVSWLSGYFITQLYNPVMFAYHGAAEAGRMGMALSMSSSLSGVALSWLSTKSSPFGQMVARKDYESLDRVFFRSLWQSLGLLVMAAGGVFAILLYLKYIHHPIGLRVLDPLPLAFLFTATIIQHIVNAEAVYLRAHKKEPFLWTSVAGGVMTALSVYILGKPYGAMGLCSANLVLVAIIGFGAGTVIFLKCRREWHG